tara:strand:- start:7286 stop:7471 length:186 start_codon:yes stop_codon:yes gene_type:complete
MELITFNNKRWKVITKVPISSVESTLDLKKMYRADLILSNKRLHYYVLEEIIDADFTEIGD